MLLRTVRVHRNSLGRAVDRQRLQQSFRRRSGVVNISQVQTLAQSRSNSVCAASTMSAKPVSNDNNAFIDPELHLQHSGGGPLTGLRFGAKDIFDVSSAAECATRMSALMLRGKSWL